MFRSVSDRIFSICHWKKSIPIYECFRYGFVLVRFMFECSSKFAWFMNEINKGRERDREKKSYPTWTDNKRSCKFSWNFNEQIYNEKRSKKSILENHKTIKSEILILIRSRVIDWNMVLRLQHNWMLFIATTASFFTGVSFSWSHSTLYCSEFFKIDFLQTPTIKKEREREKEGKKERIRYARKSNQTSVPPTTPLPASQIVDDGW